MEGVRRMPPSPRLPVLFMFLKLPKLFNFHILRLAAAWQKGKEIERKRKRGRRGRRERGRRQVEAVEV